MTTDEMDGIFNETDRINKVYAYLQCRGCTKWTKVDLRKKVHTCQHCSGNKFDLQSATSERSFNPNNKRKIK